jgi:glutamate N-acetyltransferase / amino-acid N-acetyltransferase
MSTLVSTPSPVQQASSPSVATPLLAECEFIAGGITAPAGFKAGGIHAGLKKRKKDLTLLCSEGLAHTAAVFTTNIVKAAPITWSQQALQAQRSSVKAIIINSGNANACTGPQGMIHAQQMAEATAAALQCQPQEVLVSSTGVIGVPLPIDTILTHMPALVQSLGTDADAGLAAAEGIMTTDTCVKQTAVQVEIGGKTVTIGAMAKGSGMIHPNMATMLAFITTDADVSPEILQIALRESVDESYHMISVDGDTSTNDMVVLMANGQAGNPTITSRTDANYEIFRQALNAVNRNLAETIAKDGEGATKFLTANVTSAGSKSQAKALAKAIVSSTLVKAAFYGADANWGRIISSMGATGVPFEPGKVSLSLVSEAGAILMLEKGEPLPFDEDYGRKVLEAHDIEIRVELHAGASSATAWGCDLTHDYVSINSSYRS